MDDSETESGSEIEPDRHMAKYLSLQSRIFDIQPEYAQVRHPALKKQKAAHINKEVTQLLEKVQKIESDVLFDSNEALSKWTEMRSQLAKEAAERRKFNLDQNPRLKEKPTVLPLSKDEKLADTVENVDPIDMLGDLFSSLPEASINPDTGATQIIGSQMEGEIVVIRDFGKWTGQNPRRIFEEACKARFAMPSI